jgi:nitroimidazol reductase NimA-like FMN-containing flavoprotein (pyridoxamine 5'-phosphate oxidase superfamily)
MRRAEREIKDRKTIDEILQQAAVCRLGLCEGGMPYVVPVNFGYDGDCLYFHSAPEGRKMEIIGTNPKVCFEVDVDHEIVPTDTACNWTARFRSVIGFGKARLVEDPEEKRRALDVILGHYSDGPYEYASDALAKVAVIRVQIDNITGKQSGY